MLFQARKELFFLQPRFRDVTSHDDHEKKKRKRERKKRKEWWWLSREGFNTRSGSFSWPEILSQRGNWTIVLSFLLFLSPFYLFLFFLSLSFSFSLNESAITYNNITHMKTMMIMYHQVKNEHIWMNIFSFNSLTLSSPSSLCLPRNMISFSPWIIHPSFHLLIITPFSPPSSLLLLRFLPQFFLSIFHSFSLFTKLKSHQYPDFVSHECVVSVTRQSSFVLHQLFSSILSFLCSLSLFSTLFQSFFSSPILPPLFQLNNNWIFIFGTRWSPSCIYVCIWYTIELENAWKKKSVLNRSKSDDPEFFEKFFQSSNDFSFHTWWRSISVIWLNLTVSFLEHDSSNPFLWTYPTFLSFGRERTREWNRERENHEFRPDSALNINGGKGLLTKIWSKSFGKH